jgi:peptide/nickel transport system substrate-binding protein
LVGAVGALIAVALVGCSAATPAAEPTEEAPAAIESLVIAANDISGLDPASIRSTSGSLVNRNIYGTLFLQEMDIDADGVLTPTESYAPGIAEDITWAADGLSAVITIDPDARFADGEPILAEDAVYSIQRTLSSVSTSRGLALFMGIADAATDVAVIDDTSFSITLNHTTAVLEKMLSFQTFALLDKTVADENATADDPWALKFFANQTTPSGPYAISDWTVGSSLTLEPSPETSQLLETSPQSVTINVIPDATQRLLAVSGGAADIALELPPELLVEAAENPDLTVAVDPTGSVHYLGLNNTVAPFDDVRVRQAISLAVPYDAIADAVMLGYGQVAGGPIPEPIAGSAGLDLAYETDLDEARELLEDAGFADGDIQVELAVSSAIPAHVQAATFVQEALGEIGITVNVASMSNADFAQRRLEKTLPMFISWWSSWGMDPFYQLYFLLRTGVPTNFVGYSNPELDDLIDRGIVATDPAERDELALEAQKIALEDAPMAYLFTDGTAIVQRADLRGVGSGDDRQPRLDLIAQ